MSVVSGSVTIDDFSYEAGETRAVMTLVEALYADRPGYREKWRP